jgi:predicted component of type VI protein secretion system
MTFVPAYPRIDAIIRENKTGELTVNGTSRPLVAADLARLRAGVIARCAALARQINRPVRVHVVDVAGTYSIAIHPDAFVQVLDETGNTPDLASHAARPISNSPCRKCGTSIPVSAVGCASCQVDSPHDVEAAPASTRITAPITIPVPPARAEPSELLARWSPPPAVQTPESMAASPNVEPANRDLDVDDEQTVIARRRKPRPTPILRFSNSQTLSVITSALVGRKPTLNEGETVETLFVLEDKDRTVSKTHFRIDWHDDKLTIIDRHSGNGIVVERGGSSPRTLVPMAPFELQNEDRVLIGHLDFRVGLAQ